MSKQTAKQSNATDASNATEQAIAWRAPSWATEQAEGAATGTVAVTDEQQAVAAQYVGDNGRVASSGGLLRGIDFAPNHDKPRSVRRGSKSETLLSLATRPEGATLYEIADALSVTGAHVTPSYARAWAARSYIAPLGYGLASAVTTTAYGPVLRIWAYVSDKALTEAQGTEQASTRRDTEQGRKREPSKAQGKATPAKRQRKSRAKPKATATPDAGTDASNATPDAGTDASKGDNAAS